MNTQSFVSWNIRGVNSRPKQYLLRLLIQKEQPAICCLQETKCSEWKQKVVDSFGFRGPAGWIDAPARGKSGGLISIWNEHCINITSHSCSENWILIRGTFLVDDINFVCINVYAPQKTGDKQRLWEDLMRHIQCLNDTPILMMGDFNAVRFKEERDNCIFNEHESTIFESFISSTGLIDTQLSNSEYTWFGPSQKKSRLDRVLMSSDWYSQGDWVLSALARKTSDHRPLCLRNMKSNWGPRPFQFFNCWLENEELVHNLKRTWEGCNSENILHKFKQIKEYAREWNKTKNGNIEQRITEAERVQDMKDAGELNAITETEESDSLASLYAIKTSMLCQKARLHWMLKGERNTRFFHRIIAKRRAVNSIRRVKLGCNYILDPNMIKKVFYDHFRNFLSTPNSGKIFDITNLPLPKLKNNQSFNLTAEFTIKEIEEALAMTDKTKAPGPDGMNAGVLTALWPTIKDEVLLFLWNCSEGFELFFHRSYS